MEDEAFELLGLISRRMTHVPSEGSSLSASQRLEAKAQRLELLKQDGLLSGEIEARFECRVYVDVHLRNGGLTNLVIQALLQEKDRRGL